MPKPTTPPGQAKKQEIHVSVSVAPATTVKIRWLRTVSAETFRNGDKMYEYTLQFWDATGKGAWKTVPTFEIVGGKSVEI